MATLPLGPRTNGLSRGRRYIDGGLWGVNSHESAFKALALVENLRRLAYKREHHFRLYFWGRSMDFAAARKRMVASQIRTNEVTDPLVIAALEAVPREQFVPAAVRGVAYVDEDLPLGKGRFLMEPMVLARLLQFANVGVNDTALVVGAGTGYTAAVLARMVKAVVAVESDRELTDSAARTLGELSVNNATVVMGDLRTGWAARGPYDVIVVEGAVTAIPEALKLQLADGGRLVAVVRQGPIGRATLVTRIGNAFGMRQEFDAVTAVLPGFEPQPKFVF